jgi:putative tryptophan/tyrosine transport system substrate-binding protein
MHRRRALAALASLAIPAALAQPRTRQVRRIRRVTVLFFGTPANSRRRREAFVKAMQELGYVEGRSVRYEWRYANGQPDLVARYAREVDHEVVDVIVTFSNPVATALRDAKVRVPVVMIGVDDPVRGGFADELSRPGRNFTGMTTNVVGQAPRYVDLLHEAIGKADRIGLLAVPTSSTYAVFRSRVQEQAARRGLQLSVLDASTPGEIERAMPGAHPGMDGLIVTSDTLLYNERRRIAELAVEGKLPVIYPRFGYVEVGGLMSYAPNEEYFATRGAAFTVRILDGDSPADMPIEGPTRYELAVSRKAAHSIGLVLPASLVQKADRIVA